MTTQVLGPSHRCCHCRHEYTPAATESEDCPSCGSDGTDDFACASAGHGTLDTRRLLHRIVHPLASASGIVSNATEGIYGELTPEQRVHLLDAEQALHTALTSVRQALEPTC